MHEGEQGQGQPQALQPAARGEDGRIGAGAAWPSTSGRHPGASRGARGEGRPSRGLRVLRPHQDGGPAAGLRARAREPRRGGPGRRDPGAAPRAAGGAAASVGARLPAVLGRLAAPPRRRGGPSGARGAQRARVPHPPGARCADGRDGVLPAARHLRGGARDGRLRRLVRPQGATPCSSRGCRAPRCWRWRRTVSASPVATTVFIALAVFLVGFTPEFANPGIRGGFLIASVALIGTSQHDAMGGLFSVAGFVYATPLVLLLSTSLRRDGGESYEAICQNLEESWRIRVFARHLPQHALCRTAISRHALRMAASSFHGGQLLPAARAGAPRVGGHRERHPAPIPRPPRFAPARARAVHRAPCSGARPPGRSSC